MRRILVKGFIDAWLACLPNSQNLEGMIMDHGWISDGGLSHALTFREP
jgi:hypothetical protein